jgi:hypothetical protein
LLGEQKDTAKNSEQPYRILTHVQRIESSLCSERNGIERSRIKKTESKVLLLTVTQLQGEAIRRQ